MGNLLGHSLRGLVFFIVGFWHLINHTKEHTLQQDFYISSTWFPTSKMRYLEPLCIMIGSSIAISIELFIGLARHQPLDVDGTIPSSHLRHFEHSMTSVSFFVYAGMAILLDKTRSKAQRSLTHFLAAIAFAQELLLFHLHSTDHMGIEGQYHFLLQLIIVVSLTTTVMGIGYPRSFMVSFVRSFSILFQGVWLIVMGFMVWTPELLPKGCSLLMMEHHEVVTCADEMATHRATSLINLLFCWLIIVFSSFSVFAYLGLVPIFDKEIKYSSLAKEPEKLREKPHFANDLLLGKGYAALDVEK